MSRSIQLSYEFIQQAAQQPGVRKAVEDVAKRVAKRAEGIAKSEGVKMNVTVDSAIRPGGRPRSNVVADNSAQEWGKQGVSKRRILGRAAEDAA